MTQSILENQILTGVIAGVASSALLLALGSLFRQVILPWYSGVIYRGIRIGGTWRSEPSDHHAGEYVLQFRQHAHRVKGTLVRIGADKLTGKRRSDVFDFSGTVRDRFLIATATPIASDRLGAIAVVLQISGDGRELVGQRAFYHIQHNDVRSSPITWNRESTQTDDTSSTQPDD